MTETQYVTRLIWLYACMSDCVKYQVSPIMDKVTDEMVLYWANEGLRVHPDVSLLRMRAANIIYNRYIKDVYHDK